MTNPERVYWDSSTYLDFLTGEHARHDMMSMIIEDWRSGAVTMVTSALTIAEVLFVRIGGRVDRTRDGDLEALFDPPPGTRLLLVELNRLTAFRARDVARTGVQPRDAIHIASALEAACPVLHTNDEGLWTRTGLVGGTPPLRIEAPAWTRQLTVIEEPESGAFTSLVDPTSPPPPAGLSPGGAPD